MSGHLGEAGLGSELVARDAWSRVKLDRPRLLPLDLRTGLYRVAIVTLVLLGAYLRSRRYWLDPLGLWVDEATWGLRLFRRSLTALEFRPIAYMALTKLIVKVYCDERTLRLLSYAAGLLSLPLSADLAKYLFRSRWVRVSCVAVVAYNPLLIDMAREFKPYSVEFFVHLTLVWLFVRWKISRSRTWFAALLLCSVFAFTFAYNIVFLLPGLFTVLGYTLLRAKAQRALAVTVVATLAAMAVMLAVYVCVLRGTVKDDDGGTEQFWGKKYDVFYLPSAQPSAHPLARASWLIAKYRDLAVFPGSHGNKPSTATPVVSETTGQLSALGSYAWLALHFAGLAALIAYRRQWLLLLTSPLLVCAVFNGLNLWPFGAFRSNVFLLVYLILIPMFGLDALLSLRAPVARLAGAAGVALLLAANLSTGFEPHIRKHFFCTQSEMGSLLGSMASVRAQQPERLRLHATLVLLDSYSCAPFIFDAVYNDSARRAFGDLLGKGIDARCPGSLTATTKVLNAAHGKPFFVVVSDQRAMLSYARMLRQHTHVLDHETIRGTHDLYFVTAR
jgi:hypothetical protein